MNTGTVVPTMTSTSAQDTQPTSVAPILPLSTIIAIAVSGGVLVLIVFIVIVSLVICCVLHNRTKKLSMNSSHNPDQLVRNQAYNSSNASELVGNPAYNYNSQDDPYYSVIHE